MNYTYCTISYSDFRHVLNPLEGDASYQLCDRVKIEKRKAIYEKELYDNAESFDEEMIRGKLDVFQNIRLYLYKY